MFKIKDFSPRKYQEVIAKTAADYNTLIILPTGLGKTKTAILAAIDRLNSHPNTQILFLPPTKPLSSQIRKEFIKNTNIEEEFISLLTGAITPKKRKDIFSKSKVIIATPQTIQKDLENNRISLEDASLLVIDEAHRSRENFANTKVASFYEKQSQYPRIIALTASPGGSREKINEICKNLFIEKVEIRDEHHEEVSEFVKKKDIKWVEVSLPKEMKDIHKRIKSVYKSKLKELPKLGFNKPLSITNKTDLLKLQSQFRREIEKKNQIAYYGISLTSHLIKLDFLLELLETQGLGAVQKYWVKLNAENSKAAKAIVNNVEIKKAVEISDKLIENNVKHPKLVMLRNILKEESKNKVIVFTNYRDTIEEILNFLREDPEIKPLKLIGQKLGLSQKEQVDIIKKFEKEEYNVLICTSIGEEGLDILGASLAIFYDSVPSEIRAIQRAGRVGRLSAGRIIQLITKDTREQGYYWSAKRKEKTMRSILKKMQDSTLLSKWK